MYIVRDKKTHKVIHQNPAPLSTNLKEKEVYKKFDAKKMEILKTDEFEIPTHFSVGKGGLIFPLSPAEQVKKGLIALSKTQKIDKGKIVDKSLDEQRREGLIHVDSHQKIENNEVVNKSLEEQLADGSLQLVEPFQQVVGGEIVNVPIEDLIRDKKLKTKAQIEIALSMLDDRMEAKINRSYTQGFELKITKGYLAWMAEEKPENDPRENAFLEMQKEIDQIKKEFKKVKDQLKKALEKA